MNSTPDGGASDMMSLAPVVLYEHAGRWSAATSVGLLFHNLSATEAEARLAEVGVTSPLVSVDGLTWRSTFMAATANELEAISATLETLPQSADVEAIKTRQEVIAENLATISASIAAEKSRRAEIAELEADLQRRFPIIKQALPGTPTDAEVWAVLNATPQAKRLRELR